MRRGAFRRHHALSRPSSLQEFVKDAGSYSKKMVDDLLDQITGGDHSRMLFQLRQVGVHVPRLWGRACGKSLSGWTPS